jgi:SOS-response transcriptional repressor LexA
MMTPTQNNALRFIRSYIENNGGVSPSFTEIGAALGLKSKSNVSRIVVELERRGHIRRLHNRMRAIEVLEPRDVDLQALLAQAPAPPINWLGLTQQQLYAWGAAYQEWWTRTRAFKRV